MNEIFFFFFLQSDGEGGESSDNLDAEDSGSEVGDDGGNDNSLKRQVTKKKKQLKFIKSPRGDFSRFQHKNGCAFESNCFVRCSPSFFSWEIDKEARQLDETRSSNGNRDGCTSHGAPVSSMI